MIVIPALLDEAEQFTWFKAYREPNVTIAAPSMTLVSLLNLLPPGVFVEILRMSANTKLVMSSLRVLRPDRIRNIQLDSPLSEEQRLTIIEGITARGFTQRPLPLPSSTVKLLDFTS
jgi:hypothetical protein